MSTREHGQSAWLRFGYDGELVEEPDDGRPLLAPDSHMASQVLDPYSAARHENCAFVGMDGREHPGDRTAVRAVCVRRTGKRRKDAGARRARSGHTSTVLACNPTDDGFCLGQGYSETMVVETRVFGERIRCVQRHALEMSVATPHGSKPLLPPSLSGGDMSRGAGGTLSASSKAPFKASPVH